MRKAKVDRNQQEIVKALRKCGASVEILSMVGVQALIETAICSVISFTVSKTLLLYFKKN